MMTFPVSLSLESTEQGTRLFAYPIKKIEEIHGKEYTWSDLELEPGDNPLRKVKGNLFDIDVHIDPGDAETIGLEINGFPVTYHVDEQLLIGGTGEEGDHFSSGKTQAKLAPQDGIISLRILVDRPSVEIFANDGRIYMPMQAVRDLSNKSLEIYAKGGAAHVKQMTVHEMKSIWH